MTQRERDDEGNDALDDRELPDEADMDPEGDDEPDDLIPCPHCGKKIYEDSEFCPHCGKYLSKEDQSLGKPIWVVLIVVAIVFGLLVAWSAMPR